ncbi:alpha/beta hydrolase family protein [Gordonia aquimaris]|uniref:Alpha/beta fold hydrolase n=1 Tax=Gordonia aquimaris TaxID=2984863 RepID=A0A9X3D1R3_9ACTN|nr:alpha/beta fold hydrolase [Gordonia aquimaris]MCX2963231.1 alpha/beta fold hydrolase [Gordonia aquimaris]
MYWPESPYWSFQVLRLFVQASDGGADISEVHFAVRDLRPGDVEGWYASLYALASRVEKSGDEARATGDTITARDAWRRASNYYRASIFFLLPEDQRYRSGVADRRRAFQKSLAYDDLAIRSVEIPFESGTLPGYLFHKPAPSRPLPTVMICGGADSVCEELYFALGRRLAERGFQVLTLDGPGQGEARVRGHLLRHDWETVVGAAIDFLEQDEVTDVNRIAMVGQSLGGLFAIRAAAYEPRLAGAIAWGAQWDIQAQIKAKLQHGGHTIDHLAALLPQMLGVADTEAALEALAPFRIPVVDELQCPVLVVHGAADTIVPVGLAHRLFEALPEGDNELKVFEYGEPGCEHCQCDSTAASVSVIGSWLQRQLGR